MIKHLPHIVSAICVCVIVALVSFRVMSPPVPTHAARAVVRKTIPSYRCRSCTPHKDLCPPEENLNAPTDQNASHFSCVITKTFNDQSFMGFETKRLRFREIKKEDVDAIYEYARKPMVAARTTWPAHRSKFETHRIVDNWLARYKKFYAAPWAIEEKSSGRLIGTAGIPAVYPSEPRAFIAYCLSDTAWGNGYEIEVIRALIEFGCIQAKCIRMEMMVRESDPFSQKVAEQAGMSDEGIELDYKRIGDEYVSLRHYAILRKEIRPALRGSVLG